VAPAIPQPMIKTSISANKTLSKSLDHKDTKALRHKFL
jgi:hypothetical protein